MTGRLLWSQRRPGALRLRDRGRRAASGAQHRRRPRLHDRLDRAAQLRSTSRAAAVCGRTTSCGEQAVAHVPDFGKVTSPLVMGGLVVVSAGAGAGRSLVAYSGGAGAPGGRARRTRELQLAAGRDARRRATGGHPQQSSVAAHDPATGRVLWEHPWPRAMPSVAASPAVSDITRFVLGGVRDRRPAVRDRAGRGRGDAGARLGEHAPEGEVREPGAPGRIRLRARRRRARLLDPATGERRWHAGRYGHGQTILAGNRCWCRRKRAKSCSSIPCRCPPGRAQSGPSTGRPGTRRRSPGHTCSFATTRKPRVRAGRVSQRACSRRRVRVASLKTLRPGFRTRPPSRSFHYSSSLQPAFRPDSGTAGTHPARLAGTAPGSPCRRVTAVGSSCCAAEWRRGPRRRRPGRQAPRPASPTEEFVRSLSR